MKRTDKEIKKAIATVAKSYFMGADCKEEKIATLEECLELDEADIWEKIEEYIESDYDLYVVYDWVIGGRDNF